MAIVDNVVNDIFILYDEIILFRFSSTMTNTNTYCQSWRDI